MREGWTYKKLGEVATISAGQGAPQGESNYCTNGTPFIKAGNLEDLVNGYPEENVQNVSEDVAKSHRLKKYKAGSVLFAKSGMSCMKGWVYTLKNDCYVVSHLAIVTPTTISPHFLNYYFCYHRPNSLVQDSAYPSISLKDIEALKVPVPTLQEQHQIVSELDLLSSVIEKQKAQIEELDKLAQSIFYDMFGDPVENEKGWEVKKLVQVSSKITNGNTPKGGSDVYIDEGILFFRSQNVWRNRIDLDDIAYIDEETHKKLHNSSLMHNDILITKTGRFNTENSSLGRASLYEGTDNEANINGHVYLVRLKSGMIHKFVLYILISNSFRNLIRRVCVGGIDKRQLNKNHIEDFPIIIPPHSLQQEFAQKIQAIESMKAKVRQSLKESETLFNSRMDYYFS